MTGREAISLVAERELHEGFRSRAWRISVAVQVALVAAIAIVSVVTGGDDGPSKRTVAVSGPGGAAIVREARAQQAGFGIELELERVASHAAGRQAVEDGDADAALGQADLITGEDPDQALVGLLDSSFRQLQTEARLRRLGLSPAQIETALEPPSLLSREIEVGEGDGGSALAYIGALLLYIAILSFGYAVASSVVSEKASRVVEVVLSAIRARHMLAGKVIGVGLLGLVQIITIAVVGLAIAVPAGAVSLPASTAETVLLVFVYFVLGYAFYGCAFAAAASLVSRQEDSQSTTTPILIALIASYIATNAALGNPDGSLAQIGTFLPPMAPLVVPGRAALGELPAWELALSLLIMLASILVVMRLAGRIYDRSVLRFGTPMKLREALRQQSGTQAS